MRARGLVVFVGGVAACSGGEAPTRPDESPEVAPAPAPTRQVAEPEVRRDAGDDDASASANGDCDGPGHYSYGKNRSNRPCCPGLTKQLYLSSFESQQGRVCSQAPGGGEYACTVGTCGDGVCEAAESLPCGCVADCPAL